MKNYRIIISALVLLGLGVTGYSLADAGKPGPVAACCASNAGCCESEGCCD